MHSLTVRQCGQLIIPSFFLSISKGTRTKRVEIQIKETYCSNTEIYPTIGLLAATSSLQPTYSSAIFNLQSNMYSKRGTQVIGHRLLHTLPI